MAPPAWSVGEIRDGSLVGHAARNVLRISNELFGTNGGRPDASKTLWTIPDAGHTSAFVRYGEIYRHRLVAFLGQRLADIRGNLSQAGADISGHQSRWVKTLCCARR